LGDAFRRADRRPPAERRDSPSGGTMTRTRLTRVSIGVASLYCALVLLAPAAHALAGKTKTVILASGLGPPFFAYQTAIDGGFMKKHDVNAEIRMFPSGVESIIAVGAGEAHVSNGSCSTVMRNRANGSKMLVVARNVLNPNEHKLIASAEVKKPDDLKGKKVGYLLASSTDWYASKYFAAFGLKEGTGADAVTLLNISAPEWIPALQRGDIQAFFGWDPWVTRAPQIVSGAHVLHNGGDNGLFILMNCMVFNEDWVKNDPESAKATLMGLIEAHDAANSARDEAAKRAAGPMRVSATELAAMAQCCTFKVDYTPDFVAHAREAAIWAKGKGMLKDVDPDALLKGLMYPDLLRSVAADRVTVP
jgi:ABC-type nitrate/sulfonate/bicarbonate transport system substrate-binding protein